MLRDIFKLVRRLVLGCLSYFPFKLSLLLLLLNFLIYWWYGDFIMEWLKNNLVWFVFILYSDYIKYRLMRKFDLRLQSLRFLLPFAFSKFWNTVNFLKSNRTWWLISTDSSLLCRLGRGKKINNVPDYLRRSALARSFNIDDR